MIVCLPQVHFLHFVWLWASEAKVAACYWCSQCSSHQNEQSAHLFIHEAVPEYQLWACLCTKCQDAHIMVFIVATVFFEWDITSPEKMG